MMFELQRMLMAEKKSILIMVVLSIMLPTLDTFTDLRLIYRLFRGAEDTRDTGDILISWYYHAWYYRMLYYRM